MDIQNGELVSNVRDQLKIQPNDSLSPVNIVYSMNPFAAQIVKNGTSSTTSDVTLYQTPNNKDFFLTHVSLSVTKDAACDCVGVRLYIYSGGAQVYVIYLRLLTGVATNDNFSLSFPFPIKVDRGTAVYMSGSITAGTIAKTGFISGFLL